MSTNAKLIIDWSNKTNTVLDCTWRHNGVIDEGEEIALQMYRMIQSHPNVTLLTAYVFYDLDLMVYQEIKFDTEKMTVSTKPWSPQERAKKYISRVP